MVCLEWYSESSSLPFGHRIAATRSAMTEISREFIPTGTTGKVWWLKTLAYFTSKYDCHFRTFTCSIDLGPWRTSGGRVWKSGSPSKMSCHIMCVSSFLKPVESVSGRDWPFFTMRTRWSRARKPTNTTSRIHDSALNYDHIPFCSQFWIHKNQTTISQY